LAIYRLGELVPRLGARVWVAESAVVIGDVALAEDANIWYGAVLRADNAGITIGARSNVQDNSVLHTDPGMPLVIGADVTVGHQVMAHGCTIGDGCLIGMRAVIMNQARIGRGCIVGAGAIVTERKEFPDGSLIMGTPARAVRTFTPEEMADLARIAPRYCKQAERHRQHAVRIDLAGTGGA
jgi:carbonic anhydrase/acetyltransferase-like protein (isoleucine patch superfamily)